MEGDLSLLSIPDLLQMICLARYSRDIHVFDGPMLIGVMAIREGRVVRCIGMGSRGQEAFYRLVGLRHGRYKVHEAKDTSVPDATLAAYAWQELLLEAARRDDETEHLARSLAAGTGRGLGYVPPAATSFDVPPPQPPSVTATVPSSVPMSHYTDWALQDQPE